MPEPVVATPETPVETFADFHKRFSGPAPADAGVPAAVEDVSDTGEETPAAPADAGAPEVADGSDPSSKQDKVEKRKQQIQRDIDAQVARRETARREADAEEARLAKLKTGTIDTKPGEQPAKTSAAPAAAQYDGTDPSDALPKFPDSKDAKYAADNGWELFEQDKLNWAVDKAKWDIRKESRVANFQANVSAQQKAHKEALDAFEVRGSEFAAEHPDYPALVETFKSRSISNETAAVIVEASNGPEILHHLMTNPDELKRIEALPNAIKRFDAIYELKYRLLAPPKEEGEAPPPKPAPKKSTAPAAGTVLRGASGGPPVTIDSAPNFESFKKAFDKKQGLRQ